MAGTRRDHHDKPEDDRKPRLGTATALHPAGEVQAKRERRCGEQSEQEDSLAPLPIKQPRGGGGARPHGNGEESLELLHPSPRLGQSVAERGDEGDEQERDGEPEPEGSEDEDRRRNWQQQSGADSDGQKGPMTTARYRD